MDINTILGWIKTAVLPDFKLWWLWAICFPLTLVWIIWSTAETKKAFNNFGGMLVAGLPALAIFTVLMGFIITGVTWLIGLVMGFKWLIFKILASALILWGLSKVPFLKTAVSWYWGSVVKPIVSKVWEFRQHAQKNPNIIYMVIGASFIAGFLNGQWVTRLTDTKELVPGLIPGISAIVGLGVLLYRAVSARKPKEPTPPEPTETSTRKKPIPPQPVDSITCSVQVEVRDTATGKPIPKLNANGSAARDKDGFMIATTKVCGTAYAKSAAACPGCGSPNPTIARPAPTPLPTPDPELPPLFPANCPHCGKEYDSKVGYKFCPDCMGPLKPVPSATDSGAPAKKVKTGRSTLDTLWDLK